MRLKDRELEGMNRRENWRDSKVLVYLMNPITNLNTRK